MDAGQLEHARRNQVSQSRFEESTKKILLTLIIYNYIIGLLTFNV